MSLSRTARILIALLLVAAAAFFWVNFFNQPDAPAPLVTQPVTVPGAAAADASRASPTQSGDDLDNPASPASTTPSLESATATASGAAAPATVGTDAAAPAGSATAQPATSTAPAVVTPPTVVLRDLIVDDLPFLVTSPPAPGEEAEADDAAAEAARRQSAQRGSINPFSPVVVQAPPAAPSDFGAAEFADASTSFEPDVVIVESDGQPPAGMAGAGSSASGTSASGSSGGGVIGGSRSAEAPTPRAVAPAPTRASDLPRPLPSGTLPITPDILRGARTATAAPSGPANLAEVAAVRVPTDAASAALPAVTPQTSAARTEGPNVLGPGQPTAESVKASGSNGLPLVVGADALSRYLRDNDVRFTGTALGPLSVGVFRAKQYDQPVVLTLGQALPDTEIVLADLRGYEAKFSLGDNTQVLSLDIRR